VLAIDGFGTLAMDLTGVSHSLLSLERSTLSIVAGG